MNTKNLTLTFEVAAATRLGTVPAARQAAAPKVESPAPDGTPAHQ
ncbi:MAG TPA: hypothetical protein P5555_10310 [Candidatus Paceibacterota bacterium]|nr:hypothetical protein [Candidatus Paceibacterota bacterium]HRZ57397.1 hypothetical protein [Candidatus Paceibacterota bacterium]